MDTKLVAFDSEKIIIQVPIFLLFDIASGIFWKKSNFEKKKLYFEEKKIL